MLVEKKKELHRTKHLRQCSRKSPHTKAQHGCTDASATVSANEKTIK